MMQLVSRPDSNGMSGDGKRLREDEKEEAL